MQRRAVTVLRLVFAALASAAIVAQRVKLIERDGSVVNFLSFFTIDSNVLGIGVLVTAALTRRPSPRFDVWRGAATVYLVTTGVVYAVLLTNVGVGLTMPWVNTVLHQVMPIVVAVDWLVAPPVRPIAWRAAVWWFAFPIVWTVYTMVRGSIVDWYPYPFLDPGLHGALGVAGRMLGIAVVIALVIVLVRWVGNARSRSRS